MIRFGGIAVLGTFLCATATTKAAGDAVDASAGRALAKQWCAECHEIRPAGGLSPNPHAPTFRELVALPGFTELSLRAMLRNEHLTMPALKFTPEQTDDIVNYLMSIKIPPR
jgi:mono/diheme cytochrome c family protein